MTANSNPTAIAMIDEMIAKADLDISLNHQMLAGEIATLEMRLETIKENLAQGFNVDSGWVRESAHKVEERISKRRSLYEHRASLDHVRKAAGGE